MTSHPKIRNWLAACNTRITHRMPARRRLVIEALEHRTLLNSYMAATAADVITDIGLANSAGGTNTITLTAATSSPYILTAVDNTTDGATGLPVIAAGNNLTIVGNGDTIERSTATGTPAFRLFDVAANATLTLQNLTLQNGLAYGSGVGCVGGAIYSEGTLTISMANVQNNIAQGSNGSNGSGANTATNGASAFGGGIYVAAGMLTLSDDTLSGNEVLGGNDGSGGNSGNGGGGADASGGGLYVAQGSAATLTNDTLSSNEALGGSGGNGGGQGGDGFGGGLATYEATVTLTNNTVSTIPPGVARVAKAAQPPPVV